ncbi:acetoacetyl-CoA synthetase [Trichonephila inaurata madagascariensis]|uniref:Acetoacetyl-CoA synthetase n=1 Tax=Trichonephila inaurata madagascariensis TaxID=2747483 RepID=A0A8X6X3I4_9ARAC|nr:acetoacetyl-CoA synthetase [Trichonephila inaurata madagascariensis]
MNGNERNGYRSAQRLESPPERTLGDMNARQFTNVPLIWTPSERDGKNVKRFKKIIEEKYSVKLSGYGDLHKWSIENLCEFWTEFWNFLGVISSKYFEKVVDLNIPMSDFPKWFEGAKLNYAENLLKYRDDRLALIVDGEETEFKTYTFSEMYEETRLYAAAFRKFGLKKGDIVVCHMSNRKEAVFATQAVISIGAIWVAALPMLGTQAVLDRFQQLNPQVLLSEDGYRLEGRDVDMLPKLAEIVEGLPSLKKTLIVKSNPKSHSKDISNDFLKMGVEDNGSIPPMRFEQVSVSHPITIIYTSGSTGLPKGIMHGSSILMAMANCLLMNFDADRDSRWLSVIPAGTPVWPAHLTAHFLGQALVLYEGSPFLLSPTYFWDLVEKQKISHVIMFPDVFDDMEKRNYVPTKEHDLSSLKLLITVGTVTKLKTYDFLLKVVKNSVVSSVYGCTELMQPAVLKEMTLPTYKGEINTAPLGVSIQVLDNDGKAVVGEIGEIAVTKPIPNLPIGLWNDKDDSMYREKYFSKNNVFSLGDCGMINPVTKNFIICCRSDEALNPKGCRFGPSEIYNVVETLPEILDCLCVPQYGMDMDERAVLFLKIRDGYSFNEELAFRIRKVIERNCSFKHVPEIILEVKDIPYSITGKKTEIIVKKIINNFPHSIVTVRNPESLQYYYNIPELKGF